MNKLMKVVTLSCVLLASTTVFAACSSSRRFDHEASSIASPAQTEGNNVLDKELMTQIEKFVGRQGREREEVWQQLEAYPRKDLIARLTHAKQEFPPPDIRHFEVAFVLCNLNYEYEVNKQILIVSLDRSRKSELPSDLAAELIVRLIERGDKDLLAVLFAAADQSDGAMAEELSAFFLRRMETDPKDFLRKLSEQPHARRRKVYGLIFSETTITPEGAKELKAQLETLRADSQLAGTAVEMLRFLRSTKMNFHQAPD